MPRSFESTLFLRMPGAWAVGREEWNTNRRPLQPAAWEGREGGRVVWRDGGSEGGREGGKEGGRKGRREGWRE